MTAPDPRDSVERIVAEMREMFDAAANEAFPASQVRGWMDRLAAIPQQAGGEDVAALQAEVARLRELAKLIVDGAIPATASGHTCFVPRYQIDKLRAAIGGTGDA